MSDCEQRDPESKERIRAASPPGTEVVQEEDSTDGVGVDQERSSPGHSGGHEQPLEDQHSPKPLSATGGEGGMSQRNPTGQTVTDNTASTEVIIPVQVVNDKAVSKVKKCSVSCLCMETSSCAIPHSCSIIHFNNSCSLAATATMPTGRTAQSLTAGSGSKR